MKDFKEYLTEVTKAKAEIPSGGIKDGEQFDNIIVAMMNILEDRSLYQYMSVTDKNLGVQTRKKAAKAHDALEDLREEMLSAGS